MSRRLVRRSLHAALVTTLCLLLPTVAGQDRSAGDVVPLQASDIARLLKEQEAADPPWLDDPFGSPVRELSRGDALMVVGRVLAANDLRVRKRARVEVGRDRIVVDLWVPSASMGVMFVDEGRIAWGLDDESIRAVQTSPMVHARGGVALLHLWGGDFTYGHREASWPDKAAALRHLAERVYLFLRCLSDGGRLPHR